MTKNVVKFIASSSDVAMPGLLNPHNVASSGMKLLHQNHLSRNGRGFLILIHCHDVRCGQCDVHRNHNWRSEISLMSKLLGLAVLRDSGHDANNMPIFQERYSWVANIKQLFVPKPLNSTQVSLGSATCLPKRYYCQHVQDVQQHIWQVHQHFHSKGAHNEP